MKFIPRREDSATRKAKSARSTEQGVAGHEAASKAMGKAVGGYGQWGSRISNNSNVNVIPGGSKPRTPRNSDWDAPAGKNADGGND